jgi:hypothetical protein
LYSRINVLRLKRWKMVTNFCLLQPPSSFSPPYICWSSIVIWFMWEKINSLNCTCGHYLLAYHILIWTPSCDKFFETFIFFTCFSTLVDYMVLTKNLILKLSFTNKTFHMLEFNIATPHDNFNHGELSCLTILTFVMMFNSFFAFLIGYLSSYKSNIISFRSRNQWGIHR